MEQQEVLDIVQDSLVLIMQISTPVMLVGLFVGVTIALLQALTQVQEITLVFVPKILAIFASIMFFLPAFTKIMIAFMQMIADKIIGGGIT